MEETIRTKEKALEQLLREQGKVAVAFSSGVDSAYLLAKAQQVLGDRAAAVTARAPFFPSWEKDEAADFCRERGIRQITYDSRELEKEEFRSNPADRCYFCKKALFSKILEIAETEDLGIVVDGSNMDDLADYRPGSRAIRELGIRSPLREAGLYKKEIRELSREMGLPTWDKPSFACLASRFAYGESITEDKLRMVERSEKLLMDHGFRQLRVRIHGDLARIEVPAEEITAVTQEEMRKLLVSELKSYGFRYVTLDLQGYRTGSMNEVLTGENENNS